MLTFDRNLTHAQRSKTPKWQDRPSERMTERCSIIRHHRRSAWHNLIGIWRWMNMQDSSDRNDTRWRFRLFRYTMRLNESIISRMILRGQIEHLIGMTLDDCSNCSGMQWDWIKLGCELNKWMKDWMTEWPGFVWQNRNGWDINQMIENDYSRTLAPSMIRIEWWLIV